MIDSELGQRLLHDVAKESRPGEVLIPPGVDLEDGLSEDDAIAIALWNNRDFLATLSNLGMARGDLVQADLLTNPQMNLLFPPIGSKQLEWTVFLPIEAIILRKQRVEIAERDFQRITNELVQNGLDAARNARVAFADFVLAWDRAKLASEVYEIRDGIATLAEKRLSAGDISELEAITARIDANRSRAEAEGLKRAVQVSEAQLKLTLGIASLDQSLRPDIVPIPENLEFDVDDLIQTALAERPDVKAARIAVEAADRRVELSKKSFWRIDAVADGNTGGAGPTNAGPGLRYEIPIFNRNQGLVIRSEWTLDQANHNYFSVRDRVLTDVRASVGSVNQATANLRVLRSDVLPALSESVQLAEAAYRDGAEGYLLVLQSTSQFLDSRVRELELSADVRRALAALDRSVGSRVYVPPASTKSPTDESRLRNPVLGEIFSPLE